MAVIWGIPYLLIRVAVRDVDPAMLVFSRTGIGALVLLPVAANRGALRPLLALWRPILVYTVIEVAIPWLLLSRAEERLSSSLSGLLVAAVPLVGVVIGTLFARWDPDRERDRLGIGALSGLLVGLLGVAVLLGFDVSSSDAGSAALIAGVVSGYALGPAIVARYLSDVPALGVVAASLGLCAVGYAPFALSHLPAHAPGRVIASIVVLGVVCTALAFVLFFALIAEVGPVRATVITYVNPAVAVLLGVVFLREVFTASTAAGFALIIAGSFLAARRSPTPAVAAVISVVADEK